MASPGCRENSCADDAPASASSSACTRRSVSAMCSSAAAASSHFCFCDLRRRAERLSCVHRPQGVPLHGDAVCGKECSIGELILFPRGRVAH